AALGIEYQSAYFAVVTFKGPDGLSGVGIEKADDAVVAADEQGLIVFAINGAGIADAGRGGRNDAPRRADRERRAGKVDVVDLDAVGAGASQSAAIGAEGDVVRGVAGGV